MSKPKITTVHVFPPIPDRQFDWCAYEGDYDLGVTVGWGRTEEAAIADLMELLEERK